MRKLLYMLLIAAQALPSARAQSLDFKIVQMYRNTSGSLTITFQQLRSDSLWAEFQFGTSPSLTGTLSTVAMAYIGRTAGTFTRTFPIGPGLVWHGRIVSRDSAYRADTSNIDTMLRYPVQTGTIVPTTTGFTLSAALDAGNYPPAAYRIICGWDAAFTVTFSVDSLIGGMPVGASVTRATTLASLVYPSRVYVRRIFENELRRDTLIDTVDVLPPLVAPTASFVGAPVSTTSSLQPHVAADVHGSSSGNRVVVNRRHTPTGPVLDSIVFTPTATAGTQDFYPLFSGLPPSDTSYFNGYARNSAGTTYLPLTMAVTQDAFDVSVLLGSMQQESDTLEATVHYSNVSSTSTCDVTVLFAYGTPGNVIDTRNYPALSGAGTVNPKFIAPDTGAYFIYASAYDMPAYSIINSTRDTLQYTVVPCTVDTFYALRDTIYSGSRDTLYYATTGAPRVSVSGPTASGSLGQLNTLPLTGTTTYVLKAYGLTTVTRYLTVTVIPKPSGIGEIGGMIETQRAGMLTLCDILGRTVLRRHVESGEKIGKETLVPGMYAANIITDDGEQLTPSRILIQ